MRLRSNIDCKIIYHAKHNFYDRTFSAAIFTYNGTNTDFRIEKIIRKFIIRIENWILFAKMVFLSEKIPLFLKDFSDLLGTTRQKLKCNDRERFHNTSFYFKCRKYQTRIIGPHKTIWSIYITIAVLISRS